MNIRVALLLPLAVILLLPTRASAWSKDAGTNTGVAVVTGSVELTESAAVPDGSGGMFLVWADKRSGDLDVYAQHLDATGAATWPSNGVIVASATRDQKFARAVADGSGGVIVVWEDRRDGKSSKDIYAQRLDGNGSAKWTANGVVVKGDTNASADPRLVSDGAGGALVFWTEGTDVYGQRIDGNGLLKWTASGVPIASATSTQDSPRPVSDGAGGAYVVWEDARNGTSDIFAQLVKADGSVSWDASGLPVISATATQDDPFLVRHPDGGIIVAWREQRNSATLGKDVYVQRLNSAGASVWASGGLPISQAGGDQDPAGLAALLDGTFVATWDDGRSGVNRTYAQRFNQAGTMQWTTDGIAVTASAATAQTTDAIVPDTNGGVFLLFEDLRVGTRDLYGQHVTSSGALLWGSTATAVSTATADQRDAVAVSDGNGGLLAAWVDERTDVAGDVYAQAVNVRGGLGVPLHSRLVVAAGPGGGPRIVTYDRNGAKVASFLAFGSGFRGGVQVATADLDGDGLDEIVAAPLTAGNEVRIFSGSGTRRAAAKPFGSKFLGGLSVAAGDVNGDGITDLLVAPRTPDTEPRVMALKFTGTGMSRIRTFLAFPKTMRNGLDLTVGNVRDSATPEIVASAHGSGASDVRILSSAGGLRARFIAYSLKYTGGANVALIDGTVDGVLDVLTAPAAALSPELRLFSGAGKRIRVMSGLPSTPKVGVAIGVGDVNGDGAPDIVAATGTVGVARVRTLTPAGVKLSEFTAFPSSSKVGVRLAVGDVNGDGVADVVTSLNPGVASAVRAFAGSGTSLFEVKSFGSFKGGATVAVGAF